MPNGTSVPTAGGCSNQGDATAGIVSCARAGLMEGAEKKPSPEGARWLRRCMCEFTDKGPCLCSALTWVEMGGGAESWLFRVGP